MPVLRALIVSAGGLQEVRTPDLIDPGAGVARDLPVAAGGGDSLVVRGGHANALGNGGVLNLLGGDYAGAGDGGTVTIRGGNGSTNFGSVVLGDATTREVVLGPATLGTRVAGAFSVQGNTTLGDAASDKITFTAQGVGNLTFDNAGDHYILPDNVAIGAGKHMRLYGGASNSGAGGSVFLIGGGGTGSAGGDTWVYAGFGSTDGVVRIGTTQTSSVVVGFAGNTTTFYGSLTFGGTVAGNVAFDNAGNHDLSAATLAVGNGKQMSLIGGATASGIGGAVNVTGGAGGGGGLGGDVIVRGGNGTPNGRVYIGDSGTSAVNIGAAGVTTTITGTVSFGTALPIGSGGTGQTTKTPAFDALSPLTTKGDIIVFNGTNNVRRAVSATNGYRLSADSTQADGVNYLDPLDGFGPSPVTCLNSTAAVTGETTNTSRFLYLGRAKRAIATVQVRYRVTTLAATITWAEMGIFTSTTPPVYGGTASLSRVGFTDISAVINSTGLKSTSVAVSGVNVGDYLWVAWGVQATTLPVYRGSQADDLQSGGFQTFAGRISTMAVPTTTALAGNTLLPMWFFAKPS